MVLIFQGSSFGFRYLMLMKLRTGNAGVNSLIITVENGTDLQALKTLALSIQFNLHI